MFAPFPTSLVVYTVIHYRPRSKAVNFRMHQAFITHNTKSTHAVTNSRVWTHSVHHSTWKMDWPPPNFFGFPSQYSGPSDMRRNSGCRSDHFCRSETQVLVSHWGLKSGHPMRLFPLSFSNSSASSRTLSAYCSSQTSKAEWCFSLAQAEQ